MSRLIVPEWINAPVAPSGSWTYGRGLSRLGDLLPVEPCTSAARERKHRRIPAVTVIVSQSQGCFAAAEGAHDGEERRTLDALPETFVTGASQFRYTALDLVITAAYRVGLPVVIAGRGPDEMRVRALAAEAGVRSAS